MKGVQIIIVAILLIAAWSCNKDNIISSLNGLEQNEYYESEIFDKDYLHIYGKWESFLSVGGVVGAQETPPENYLNIAQYGIYEFLEKDSIISYGKLVIPESEDSGFLLEFEDSDLRKSRHNVEFKSRDTLILTSTHLFWSIHYTRVQ